MKRSNYRTHVTSLFLGIALALTTYLSFGNAPAAAADGWCPNPPPDCAFFACHNKKCKFIALENGASCSSGASCQPIPTLDGSFEDETDGEN